jgi:hypothetical protein
MDLVRLTKFIKSRKIAFILVVFIIYRYIHYLFSGSIDNILVKVYFPGQQIDSGIMNSLITPSDLEKAKECLKQNKIFFIVNNNNKFSTAQQIDIDLSITQNHHSTDSYKEQGRWQAIGYRSDLILKPKQFGYDCQSFQDIGYVASFPTEFNGFESTVTVIHYWDGKD